jgi:NADPH:quinone reductase-like Zn-dependent oxidoreductase
MRLYIRLPFGTGWRFPCAMGQDFSGVVESTGDQVTGLGKGDEVLGAAPLKTQGAFAEMLITQANRSGNRRPYHLRTPPHCRPSAPPPGFGLTWHRNGPALTESVPKSFLAEQEALGHVWQDVDLAQAVVLIHDMIVCDLLHRAMMVIDGGPKPGGVEMTICQAVKMAIAGLGPKRHA